MSLATAKAAIKFAAGLDDADFQLGFFGGEPLLEWNLLCEAVRLARQELSNRKLILTLTTNGMGLSAERLDWLLEQNFYLGLSMDGNRAMHDLTRRSRSGASSFDQTLRALKLLLERSDRFEVIMVPDPKNVIHAADGVAYLAELGVQRISLNPNFYVEWDAAALAHLEKSYKAVADLLLESYRAGSPVRINVLDGKIITGLKDGYACSDRCKFGCGELAVAASGRIYPCERLVGNDDDDAVCIGNVFDGFYRELYESILARRGNRDPECAQCKLQSRCMNWCGCINYTTTGAIDSTPGIVCFHEKLAIREADRVAALLFAERNEHFLRRFYRV
jgi:uncharacterized protein